MLGEEHPDTSEACNLACTYWNQGGWKERRGTARWGVMEKRKLPWERSNPDTLRSMAICIQYRNQGRWKEAEDWRWW